MLRLTRKQVREVDRIAIEEYGVPGIVLMENAARGAVDVIAHARNQSVVNSNHALILCGGGNNGGDGLAIARLLHNANWDVRIVMTSPPEKLHGDALINYRIVQAMRLPVVGLDRLEDELTRLSGGVIVDAIYGTGFRSDRPPALDLQSISDQATACRNTVVAIDVPSGLDADTGTVNNHNAIRAHYTVTFVAEKVGFAEPEAATYLGQVHVADIGAPREILDRVKYIA